MPKLQPPINASVPRRSDYSRLSKSNRLRADACLSALERSQYRGFTNIVYNLFAHISDIKSHLVDTGCIDSTFPNPFGSRMRSSVAAVLDDRELLGELVALQDRIKSVPGLFEFCANSMR